MLIFKPFEGAQTAGFVCEGVLLMVSGDIGLLDLDRFDAHFIRQGDVVILQRVADMVLTLERSSEMKLKMLIADSFCGLASLKSQSQGEKG